MSAAIESLVNREYQYGFVTDVESDTVPPGLSEDVVRLISAKKDEPAWLLEWRLKAYRRWLAMSEPHWPNVTLRARSTTRALATTRRRSSVKPLQSLDEVDPELLRTYEKLGISLTEQKRLSRRGSGRDLRFGVGRHDHEGRARGARHHVLLVRRSGARASGARRRSTSAPSFRTATTSSPRSTARCSATARSATCRRA